MGIDPNCTTVFRMHRTLVLDARCIIVFKKMNNTVRCILFSYYNFHWHYFFNVTFIKLLI